jgi:cell division protein FtsW
MKYYLPEPMNDFIFAVIAEELGVVGCLMVIFLFVYQVWRILTISKHAKDLLGTYMALGVGAHVAIQVILNIGVATSVLPNTGISLPYISYGGTALFLQLCEMGILLNISRQIPGKRIKVEGTTQLESDQEQTRESRIA